MLEAINNNHKWKKFLNKQNNEFTIGKLEYLLKRNLGKEFNIIIGGERANPPHYTARDESFQTIWQAYQEAIGIPLKLPEGLIPALIDIKCKVGPWKLNHFNITLRFTVGTSLYDFDSQIQDFS